MEWLFSTTSVEIRDYHSMVSVVSIMDRYIHRHCLLIKMDKQDITVTTHMERKQTVSLLITIHLTIRVMWNQLNIKQIQMDGHTKLGNTTIIVI